LLRRTMKELQSLLDPNKFLGVHRSAMVNLDRVKEFDFLQLGICL
jgi:DNA-binding LytR/AlgR family response regulator